MQLGVSLSRNIKTALLPAGAAKEKPFSPVALLLELRCLISVYFFQNAGVCHLGYGSTQRIRRDNANGIHANPEKVKGCVWKMSKPRGRKFTGTLPALSTVSEKLISAPSGKFARGDL